jgi:hypothetical protein
MLASYKHSYLLDPFLSYEENKIVKCCENDTWAKVVLIRLGINVFVNKARGGGSPKFFINTL